MWKGKIKNIGRIHTHRLSMGNLLPADRHSRSYINWFIVHRRIYQRGSVSWIYPSRLTAFCDAYLQLFFLCTANFYVFPYPRPISTRLRTSDAVIRFIGFRQCNVATAPDAPQPVQPAWPGDGDKFLYPNAELVNPGDCRAGYYIPIHTEFLFTGIGDHLFARFSSS